MLFCQDMICEGILTIHCALFVQTFPSVVTVIWQMLKLTKKMHFWWLQCSNQLFEILLDSAYSVTLFVFLNQRVVYFILNTAAGPVHLWGLRFTGVSLWFILFVNLIFNAVFQTQSTRYSSTLLLFGSLASDCRWSLSSSSLRTFSTAMC